MPLIKTEKYSAEKIERIRQRLQQYKDMGQPHFYEIHVDGLRAVPRTDDMEHFDLYEMYLCRDSEEIKFFLYNGTSYRNDSFIYLLKDNDSKTLSATPEIVEDKITQALIKRDIADYQKRIAELEEELSEAQEYISSMEEKILEVNKTADKQSRFWDVLTAALVKGNDMIQRNPKLLENIPVIGKDLAGSMIRQQQNPENQYQFPENTETDTEVTFEKINT